MTQATPTDPQELREEIARLRADLGATIEALAAKTDVKARAKGAVGHAAESAKGRVRAAGDRVRSNAVALRASVTDLDAPAVVRKPLPLAAIAAAAALIGVAIYLVRARRS